MESNEAEGRSGTGLNREETVRTGGLRWFIDSMLGYWILLLAVSLGAAALIYEIWLKGTLA